MTMPPPSVFMGRIRKRLADGDDAQALLDELMDMVEADKNDRIDPEQLIDNMTLLARHGARLTTEQPGCAFSRYIDKYKLSPGWIGSVREMLVNIPGELPFHVLARHYLWQISGQDLENPDILASMQARDSRGRTVSHWLWDEDNAVLDEVASACTTQDPGERDVLLNMHAIATRGAWRLQAQFEQVGVGLDIPDHEGITPLQLCLKRVRAGTIALLPQFEICQRLQAIMDHQDMQANTPGSSIASEPSGPRF